MQQKRELNWQLEQRPGIESGIRDAVSATQKGYLEYHEVPETERIRSNSMQCSLYRSAQCFHVRRMWDFQARLLRAAMDAWDLFAGGFLGQLLAMSMLARGNHISKKT